jgi:hypothetical protein
MKAFQIIKNDNMSLKIRNFADRWKNVITLMLLTSGIFSFVWAAVSWTDKQDETNRNQDRSIASIMYSDIKRDSILTIVVKNQEDTKKILASWTDWRNEFEPEHRQLMKTHNIYPNKLYHGDVK